MINSSKIYDWSFYYLFDNKIAVTKKIDEECLLENKKFDDFVYKEERIMLI